MFFVLKSTFLYIRIHFMFLLVRSVSNLAGAAVINAVGLAILAADC